MPRPPFEKTVVGKKFKKAIDKGFFSEYEAIAIFLCMAHVEKENVAIGDFWNEDITRLMKEAGK